LNDDCGTRNHRRSTKRERARRKPDPYQLNKQASN
jgi:hypothetical protein